MTEDVPGRAEVAAANVRIVLGLGQHQVGPGVHRQSRRRGLLGSYSPRSIRPTSAFPRALVAGEAAVRADGVAVVRAGKDAVELLEGRGEEDEPLSAGDLARIVEAAGDRTPF